MFLELLFAAGRVQNPPLFDSSRNCAADKAVILASRPVDSRFGWVVKL